jgi:predicted permease
MGQDLRLAIRQLAHAPAFTIAAILTFALGIGANTAVFSVMNAVVLRFLPVSNPQELVFLHTNGMPNGSSQTGFSDGSLSLTVYERLKAEKRIFSDLMAYVPLDTQPTAVRHGQTPETVWADMVSGDFFSGLGVGMTAGRGFTMHDEQQHAPIAVLSHAYWARRFDRQASVIGETLFIKGVPFTIVGVTAPEFAGLLQNPTDVWIPIQARPELKPWGRSAQSPDTFHKSPNWWFLMTIGRLAPGVTAAQATAAAQPVFERAAYEHVKARGEKEKPPKLFLTEARGIQGLRDQYLRPLTILMAMVGLVLLIACGNVAMLLMARNAARQREFGLRNALGASRWRLLRQLGAESLLLVSTGTILGWWFALAATRALAVWTTLDVTITPDRTVLLFAIGVSVLAALVFGLSPLRGASGVPLASLLRSSASNITGERKRRRFGHPVIAAQVAMCFVLLVGAGLLVRTIHNLSTADLGMRTTGLLVFGVTPPASVRGDEAVGEFYQSLSAKLRTIGGIEGVTLMANRIGSGWSNNDVARIDGKLALEGVSSPLRWNAVGSQYFHVLGVPLLLGRDLTDADDAAAPPVVIVNDTFAKRYVAGQNPLGRRLQISGRDHTIVGVAADSRYTSVRERPWPMAYVPYRQVEPGPMHVEVRTAGDPLALIPAIQRVVQTYGPDIPLVKPMTQEQQFGETISNARLFSGLATFFGLMAALLVATGLYGTLTYRISRRTSEIGVRIALGAGRGQVLWMIVRESLVVGIVGIAMGVPLAIMGARWLGSTLFGLTPGDPVSFGLALAAVALVTIGASLVPARRAATLDPMRALRSE